MKAFFRIVESEYTKDFKVIYKIYCYEKREMLHNSFKHMNMNDMKRLHLGTINKEGNKQYILTDKTGDEILEAIYKFYNYETMAYVFE